MTDVIKRKRQLNTNRGKAVDAGFSLVELLIAVTILAIIVIPLLRMFVTSTRINVKSRQTLRATTAAQDIMEGLKAYTLEEVRTQFSLPDGSASDSFFYPTEGFYIINSSMIQGGVREITELEAARDAEGNFVNKNDPDNEIYYFGIENLKMQGSEYDALIRLDASTYGAKSEERVTKAGGTPAAEAHKNDFNGAYYADVTSVSEANGGNMVTDSSYHEDKELNADILKDVKKQMEDDYTNAGADLPDTWEDDWDQLKIDGITIKRDILVTLKDAHSSDAQGNPQCKAEITFTYKCKYSGALDPNKEYTSHGLLGSSEVVNIARVFSSGNFYLFYYPIYSSSAAFEDHIEFDIQDVATLFDEDQPLLKSITLAKQIRSIVDTTTNVIAPEMSDADLFAAESAYRATVTISPNSNSTVSDNLLFRSNIETNMSRQARDVSDPNLAMVRNITHDYDPAINMIDLIGDNVSDKITNVIYDVEITIFKTGAAEYFKYANDSDFEDREEVVKLVTITNLY